MAVKNVIVYQFTVNGKNYGIHLDSNTYGDVASSIGLTPMASPPPADISIESVSRLEAEGRAVKISIGLASSATSKITKRKLLVLPVGIPFSGMLGKTIGGMTVKSANVKTYRSFR